MEKPRLVTGAVGESSVGPLVTRWAKKNMPNPMMRWNNLALNGILAVGDNGRFAHRHSLVTVARQNSKSTMAMALAGWWLDEYTEITGQPQVVTWTSHDLRLAELAFFTLAQLLDHRVTRTSSSYGRQRLHLDNGSRFHIQANTLGAGHGLSIDCSIVDEVWRVKPECVDHGLLPAQRARPNPIMVLLSTAGDEDSVLLRQWRERGLGMIESGEAGRLFFAEWSPPPGVNYNEAKYWAMANPALGQTIDADTLRDEYHSPNRNAFLRASLNLWVQAESSWLPPGQWDQCRVKTMPEPKGGVLACEIAMNGGTYYACRAWQHNGVTYTMPVVVSEYEDVFWSAVEEAYPSIDKLALPPTLEVHAPTGMTRKTVTVGLRELARAVPIVRSMVAAGQVAHNGSTLLSEHVGRAVATKQAGLSTMASTGSIELARTFVWAASMSSRPQSVRKPALAVASVG